MLPFAMRTLSGITPPLYCAFQINHHARTPRHNKYNRYDELGTAQLLLLLLFLTFSALVANPIKLLYTVANPVRGLLNREKKKKEKVWQRPPSPPPARCSFGEKKKKKKKSRDASTYLGATQVGVTQVVPVRLASVQGFLRLVS